jgi:hypothetical protein
MAWSKLFSFGPSLRIHVEFGRGEQSPKLAATCEPALSMHAEHRIREEVFLTTGFLGILRLEKCLVCKASLAAYIRYVMVDAGKMWGHERGPMERLDSCRYQLPYT